MTDDFYFGRNLDYEFTYGESVTVVPRSFKFGGAVAEHGFALIGTAHIRDGYPLFYDAANERGVCMAGLNFVGNAVYYAKRDDKKNAAQYELIPFILRQCATAAEARQILNDINITDTPFAPEMPAAQLHWLVADRTDCFVLECMEDGMHIYDNPTGVLTNNPPFPMQMFALNDYMSLSSRQPGNNFCSGLPLVTYSRDCRASCRRARDLYARRLSGQIPYPATARGRRLRSFSIFSVRRSSRGAAARLNRTSMKSRCFPIV